MTMIMEMTRMIEMVMVMVVMTNIMEMIEMVMVMMVDDEYNGNDGDGNDVDGCL